MQLIFKDHADYGEIAYAKYEERKRLIKIAHILIENFPKQFVGHSKRHKAAVEVCNKLYKEIDGTFRLI